MSENFPNVNSTLTTAVANIDANKAAADREMLATIVEAALDRKGSDVVVLRVSDVSYLADYFVLVTGFSRVQVRAISQAIQGQVEEKWQRRPLRIEGQAEANWILLDYGDAIVHILMPKEREFYNLEAFWSHAELINVTQEQDS
ncbi:ribosome silencing factor [Phormidium sp. LEGE 05292]|uniref:ribosome silencing factor n=1 Tax=[Phormidium] sp. LEGE 05292 TaxID=767427 RepID=UPI001881EA45|nr:ribosome silencing factor [Phormidium sp. LEGE 05292]MBE9225827.1 ribosome silencing factor [Phormidium sp. LEGE 05292]